MMLLESAGWTGELIAIVALMIASAAVGHTCRLRQRRRPLDLELLTWRCDVCGKTRPDRLVGAVRVPLWEPMSDVPRGYQNVRFCADRPACERVARRRLACANFALDPKRFARMNGAQRREDVGP